MVDMESQPNPEDRTAKRHSLGGGILSKGQYDYLLDRPENLSNNAIKQRRRKVRDNFQSAIPDLALLWDMDEKDLFRTFAPLTDPNHDMKSELFEIGILNERDMDNFDLAESAENDVLAKGMLEGIQELMSVIAFLFGPEDFGQLAEQALNQGQARHGLTAGKETEMYDLSLNSVPPSEKIKQYSIDTE